MKTKRCLQCGKEKILLLFARDRSRSDGRSPHCKMCKRTDVKRWRQENMGLYVGKLEGRHDVLSMRRVRD